MNVVTYFIKDFFKILNRYKNVMIKIFCCKFSLLVCLKYSGKWKHWVLSLWKLGQLVTPKFLLSYCFMQFNHILNEMKMHLKKKNCLVVSMKVWLSFNRSYLASASRTQHNSAIFEAEWNICCKIWYLDPS